MPFHFVGIVVGYGYASSEDGDDELVDSDGERERERTLTGERKSESPKEAKKYIRL